MLESLLDTLNVHLTFCLVSTCLTCIWNKFKIHGFENLLVKKLELSQNNSVRVWSGLVWSGLVWSGRWARSEGRNDSCATRFTLVCLSMDLNRIIIPNNCQRDPELTIASFHSATNISHTTKLLVKQLYKVSPPSTLSDWTKVVVIIIESEDQHRQASWRSTISTKSTKYKYVFYFYTFSRIW